MGKATARILEGSSFKIHHITFSPSIEVNASVYGEERKEALKISNERTWMKTDHRGEKKGSKERNSREGCT